MSRKTTEAERNYTSYELEALAVVRACEKFRIYLQGIEFKIVTDCEAFKFALNNEHLGFIDGKPIWICSRTRLCIVQVYVCSTLMR